MWTRRCGSVNHEAELGGVGRVGLGLGLGLLVEGAHAWELGAKKVLLCFGFGVVVDEGGHARQQQLELGSVLSDGGEDLAQAWPGVFEEVAVANDSAGVQRDDAARCCGDGGDGGGGGEREDGPAVLRLGRSLGRRSMLRDLRSRRRLVQR